MCIRDRILAPRHVDPHEAGMAHRWGRDPHVDLGGAAFAQQIHERTGGGPPYDGVVDQDHPLASEVGVQRVVFEVNSGASQTFTRLDERAPDVAVLDQTLCVGCLLYTSDAAERSYACS